MLGDAFRTGGSTSALRRATGWVPRIDLEEGLTEQYRWVADTAPAASQHSGS